MILVVGGSYQHKQAYAQGLFEGRTEGFADGRSCPFEELDTCWGIHHFHQYIRRFMEAGGVPAGLSDRIRQKNPGIQVIVMSEVGCGVVPIDAFERTYREACGRTGCALAEWAAEVHLVECGIGRVIKP